MAGYAISHQLFKAAYDISFYSQEFEKEPYQVRLDLIPLIRQFVVTEVKKKTYDCSLCYRCDGPVREVVK